MTYQVGNLSLLIVLTSNNVDSIPYPPGLDCINNPVYAQYRRYNDSSMIDEHDIEIERQIRDSYNRANKRAVDEGFGSAQPVSIDYRLDAVKRISITSDKNFLI